MSQVNTIAIDGSESATPFEPVETKFDFAITKPDITIGTDVFNYEELKGQISTLEDTFQSFADHLSVVNETVNSLVNKSSDQSVYGQYGKKFLSLWNSNVSTFSDFKMNFQAWSQAVAMIAANNQNTDFKVKEIYKDRGDTISFFEKDANGAVLHDANGKVKVAGNIGDLKTIVSPVEGGWTSYDEAAASGASNILTESEFARHIGENGYTCEDVNGESVTVNSYQEYLNVMYEKYDANDAPIGSVEPVEGGWTSYDEATAGGASNILTESEFARRIGENGYTCKDVNGESVTVNSYQEYLNVMYEKYGDSGGFSGETVDNTSLQPGEVITITNNGMNSQYKYEGMIQRSDMTQEQLFSNSNGDLYYYEDGVMKEVRISTVTQATTGDLNNTELYFQDDNGNYATGTGNSTFSATLDTDGAVQSENGYTVAARDHNGFDPSADYEGKGTTLYIPDEKLTSYNKDAKELMTTSVIDVRDNLAKEAVEMQTYLDSNRSILSPDQITALETQISNREVIAEQMGTDVQFGFSVDDGVIGDYGTTAYAQNNGAEGEAGRFEDAVARISSYPTGFTNEDGVVIPGLNTLTSLDSIVGNK